MGIKCVAVFVDVDKDAPFVKMADEAIKLSSSYMDGSAIIDAAIQSGAEAIHPGYGFLSENAAFARKVKGCLLYTSDAADELDGVDLGGRRIIKKKK